MKGLYAATAIAVFAGALAYGAVAQNTRPPANPDASTPAVAHPNANNPGAPAAGANSFTEGQAKSGSRRRAIPMFPAWSRTKMVSGEARLRKQAQPSTSHSITKAMSFRSSEPHSALSPYHRGAKMTKSQLRFTMTMMQQFPR